jgi:DNA-binding GntR family transcriptional regulator
MPDFPLFAFHQAREVFATFASLHAEATLLAVPRLEDEDFAELEAANDRLRTALQEGRAAEAIDADDDFHGVFARVCRDPDVQVGIDLIVPRIRSLDLWYFNKLLSGDDPPGNGRHSEIMAACRARDAAEAARLVRESFSRGAEQLAAEAQRLERTQDA